MVRPSRFEISTELGPDGSRLILAGELDLATVAQIEQAVRAMLAQGIRDLVIDLSGLTFVDSSGLRLFIVLSDRSLAEGWTLGLIPPSGQALTVFQISGAYDNLPFIDDPACA